MVLQVLKQADDEIIRERLIEAPKLADAFRFVARETITAELATTDDVVRLTKAGVELEKAE